MDLPITVITAFSNFCLGLLTYLKNPKSITNKLFCVLSVILAAWTIVNYFSLHSSSPEMTLFWIKMVLAIVTPMWTVLFLLALVFPNDQLKINKFFLFILVIYTLITSIVALSPYMFTGIKVSENNIQPIPGPGIILHAILAIGSLILTTIILVKKYVKSYGREKNQLKFFLVGISSSFTLLIITNFILVNVFHNTSLVPLGPLFTLILVGSISYAIVKHRFLDISLIVARAVAYALILLIIGGFYSVYAFIFGSVVFSISVSPAQLLFFGSITLVAALTFQPLKRVIEEVTDSIFYKGYYDPQELLKSLSSIMATTLELQLLTLRILDEVTQTMRIRRSVFVLLSKDEKQIEYTEYEAYDQKPIFERKDIEPFIQDKRITNFDDLEEGEIKELMRKLNISVALRLSVKGQKIGVLFLGEKSSGDIYSEQDIDVLEILAPQLSIAIQNAREYEEIKRFNITLKEEVDKATKELKDANEKLKELDKLKDEFVSIASHELRTPMTVIKSYVWTIQNDKTLKLNDKQKTYLDRTYQSVERLIKLVNDMLNVSRIESGRILIEPKPTDIVKLAEDVIAEMSQKAKEQKINLFLEKKQNLPNVLIDPDKTKEILINLVGNSLKFTPEGGKITVRIEIMDKEARGADKIFAGTTREDDLMEKKSPIPLASQENFVSDLSASHLTGHRAASKYESPTEHILVSVSDTGIGISKENLPKLFQKFGIVGTDYLEKLSTQGTGLGLYISKSIVELMGGKMWAESEGQNKGSTFSFTLKTV